MNLRYAETYFVKIKKDLFLRFLKHFFLPEFWIAQLNAYTVHNDIKRILYRAKCLFPISLGLTIRRSIQTTFFSLGFPNKFPPAYNLILYSVKNICFLCIFLSLFDKEIATANAATMTLCKKMMIELQGFFPEKRLQFFY